MRFLSILICVFALVAWAGKSQAFSLRKTGNAEVVMQGPERKLLAPADCDSSLANPLLSTGAGQCCNNCCFFDDQVRLSSTTLSQDCSALFTTSSSFPNWVASPASFEPVYQVVSTQPCLWDETIGQAFLRVAGQCAYRTCGASGNDCVAVTWSSVTLSGAITTALCPVSPDSPPSASFISAKVAVTLAVGSTAFDTCQFGASRSVSVQMFSKACVPPKVVCLVPNDGIINCRTGSKLDLRTICRVENDTVTAYPPISATGPPMVTHYQSNRQFLVSTSLVAVRKNAGSDFYQGSAPTFPTLNNFIDCPAADTTPLASIPDVATRQWRATYATQYDSPDNFILPRRLTGDTVGNPDPGTSSSCAAYSDFYLRNLACAEATNPVTMLNTLCAQTEAFQCTVSPVTIFGNDPVLNPCGEITAPFTDTLYEVQVQTATGTSTWFSASTQLASITAACPTNPGDVSAVTVRVRMVGYATSSPAWDPDTCIFSKTIVLTRRECAPPAATQLNCAAGESPADPLTCVSPGPTKFNPTTGCTPLGFPSTPAYNLTDSSFVQVSPATSVDCPARCQTSTCPFTRYTLSLPPRAPSLTCSGQSEQRFVAVTSCPTVTITCDSRYVTGATPAKVPCNEGTVILSQVANCKLSTNAIWANNGEQDCGSPGDDGTVTISAVANPSYTANDACPAANVDLDWQNQACNILNPSECASYLATENRIGDPFDCGTIATGDPITATDAAGAQFTNCAAAPANLPGTVAQNPTLSTAINCPAPGVTVCTQLVYQPLPTITGVDPDTCAHPLRIPFCVKNTRCVKTLVCGGSGSPRTVQCWGNQVNIPDALDCTMSGGYYGLTPATGRIGTSMFVECPRPIPGDLDRRTQQYNLQVIALPNNGGDGCADIDNQLLIEVQSMDCNPPVAFTGCSGVGLSASNPLTCTSGTISLADVLLLTSCAATDPTNFEVLVSGSTTDINCPLPGDTDSFPFSVSIIPAVLGVSYPIYPDTASCGKQTRTLYVKNTACVPIDLTCTTPNVVTCTKSGNLVNLEAGSGCSNSDDNWLIVTDTFVPCPAQQTAVTYPLTFKPAEDNGDPTSCASQTITVTVVNIGCEPENAIVSCGSVGTASNPLTCTDTFAQVPISPTGCQAVAGASLTANCICPTPGGDPAELCTISSEVTISQDLIDNGFTTATWDTTTCGVVTRDIFVKNTRCTGDNLATLACNPSGGFVECTVENATVSLDGVCTLTNVGGSTEIASMNNFLCPPPGKTVEVTVTTYSSLAPPLDPETCTPSAKVTIANTVCSPPVNATCQSTVFCTGNGTINSLIQSACAVTPAPPVTGLSTVTNCASSLEGRGSLIPATVTFAYVNSLGSDATCSESSTINVVRTDCPTITYNCSNVVLSCAQEGTIVVINPQVSGSLCGVTRSPSTAGPVTVFINGVQADSAPCPAFGAVSNLSVAVVDSWLIDYPTQRQPECALNTTVTIRNAACNQVTISCGQIFCKAGQTFLPSAYCNVTNGAILNTTAIPCPTTAQAELNYTVVAANSTGTDPSTCTDSDTLRVKNFACSNNLAAVNVVCSQNITCSDPVGTVTPTSISITAPSGANCAISNPSIAEFLTTTVPCPAPSPSGNSTTYTARIISKEVVAPQPYDVDTCTDDFAVTVKNTVCNPGFGPAAIACACAVPNTIYCGVANAPITVDLVRQSCSIPGGVIDIVGTPLCPASVGGSVAVTLISVIAGSQSPRDPVTCERTLVINVVNSGCNPAVDLTCSTPRTSVDPHICSTQQAVNLTALGTCSATPATATITPGVVHCPDPVLNAKNPAVPFTVQAAGTGQDTTTCRDSQQVWLKNNDCIVDPPLALSCVNTCNYTATTALGFKLTPCRVSAWGIITAGLFQDCPGPQIGAQVRVTISARVNNTAFNGGSTCTITRSLVLTNIG